MGMMSPVATRLSTIHWIDKVKEEDAVVAMVKEVLHQADKAGLKLQVAPMWQAQVKQQCRVFPLNRFRSCWASLKTQNRVKRNSQVRVRWFILGKHLKCLITTIWELNLPLWHPSNLGQASQYDLCWTQFSSPLYMLTISHQWNLTDLTKWPCFSCFPILIPLTSISVGPCQPFLCPCHHYLFSSISSMLG